MFALLPLLLLSLASNPFQVCGFSTSQTIGIDPPPNDDRPAIDEKNQPSSEKREVEPAKAHHLFDAVYSKKNNPGPPPIIDLLDVKNADLVDVLRFLCEKGGAQLVVDPSVGRIEVTCRLENISWLQAAHIIIKNAGLDARFEAGILKTGNTGN